MIVEGRVEVVMMKMGMICLMKNMMKMGMICLMKNMIVEFSRLLMN